MMFCFGKYTKRFWDCERKISLIFLTFLHFNIQNYVFYLSCINIQKKCGLINDYLKNKPYLCVINFKTKNLCQKI